MTDYLKLNRALQRKTIEDYIDPAPRMLVFLTHGEVEQGHGHFSRLVSWRLSRALKGQWKEVVIDWPPPSGSPGMRFAEIIEDLALILRVRIAFPERNPFSDHDDEEWEQCFSALRESLRGFQERIFIRNVLRWPNEQDAQIIEYFVSRVWAPVADSAAGSVLILGFEVVRAERSGMPFAGRVWRLSRREHLDTRRIARGFEQIDLGAHAHSIVLDELTSVTVRDLTEWLRGQRHMNPAQAEEEARDIFAATRGGRFERVVYRISRGPRREK